MMNKTLTLVMKVTPTRMMKVKQKMGLMKVWVKIFSSREGFKKGDLPLYDGAPITLSESVLSILALSFAHNLSGSSLGDILELIALHCKEPNLCRNTLFKFRSVLSI